MRLIPVLAAVVLAACGPTNRQEAAREQGAGAANPPVPPVFVMAEVVGADAAAKTITVKASSGATSATNTPAAGANAAPGQPSTLPVTGDLELLGQLKPGDLVTLTCNMVKGPGTLTPPSPDATTCGSVTSISKQAGAAK